MSDYLTIFNTILLLLILFILLITAKLGYPIYLDYIEFTDNLKRKKKAGQDIIQAFKEDSIFERD
jgi:hypothetical protein